MSIYLALAVLLGAVWGSFLNVIALRLLSGDSLFEPSHCPQCLQRLSWYELIPLLSWIGLKGVCRFCHQPISWWYPLIESLSAAWFAALYQCTIPTHTIPILIVFGSALIITIRTDGEQFLILRLCTIGLMPLLLTASFFGLIACSWQESVAGILCGVTILSATRWVFFRLRGHEGLGLGDIELLGAIGGCVGPLGVWATLMVGSFSGTLYAVVLMACNRATTSTPIPFGLFLAAAGLIIALIQNMP